MSENFAVGEIAHHVGLGAGKVLEVESRAGQQHVKVAFNGQTSSLLSSFLSHSAEGAKEAIKIARSKSAELPASKRKTAAPFELTLYNEIDLNVSKEWTVEDWMGLGELVVPYGKPGCGKSVLMGDLACHVAAGEPWFGKQVRCSSVLYVAAERAQLVERRFAAFRKHHEAEDLPIGIIKGYFDLAKAKVDTDRIIETVRQLVARTHIEPAIVIIDTKRQVIGDENSDDVGHLVGNIARIQHETGAGVIVIDHSPFHSPTKPSGRGELIAAADATILVEQAGDVRTARIVKVNDGPDDLTLAFELTSVSLGTHATTGKVTTAPVVQPADRPKTSSKGADRLTPSESIAFSALEEAVVDAGEKIASSRAPSDARGVSVELWRDYAYKRGITDGDNPEARKKAFQRARQSLLAKNRIGTWAERVWIIAQTPDISGLTGRNGTRDIAGTKPGQENEH